MTRVTIIGSLIALAVGLLGSTPSHAAGVRITEQHIRVGDLVPGCQGESCGVTIGRAPLPGKCRTVRRVEIKRALIQAQLDHHVGTLPARRRVCRRAVSVSPEELRSRIESAVTRVLPPDTFIEKLGRLGRINVPTAEFEVVASWPGMRSFRRQISIPVELVANGESFRSLQVSATLVQKKRLPVAARDLPTGVVLDPSAIQWKVLSLDAASSRFATQLPQLIGRRLEHPLARGERFPLNGLAAIPVITRGQQITVESSTGLIRIKARGIARQDGAVGDRIRVAVRAVQRLVWAEVTAPGLAMVVQ